MKILAFGDPHGDTLSLQTAKQKAHEADLVICLGDITWFGEELDAVLAYINEFPKKVLMIHGNHEQEELMEEACKAYDNIIYLHGQKIEEKEFTFLAYGGDGFSRRDPLFENIMEELAKDTKDMHRTVLLLHGPPINTKIDQPFEDFHSGSESYREFIEKHQPLLVLAGHIHEGEKLLDMIEDATVFNPGPDGEILDLEVLHTQRKKSKLF
jgi:Icc-related predicted phosphoesterase